MTEEFVITAGSEAIKTVVFIAGPMLIAAMIVGIIISVLQAITQINEATLTFIPKMIAVGLVLLVMAPWMMKIMQDYALSVFGNIHEWVR